MNETIAGKRLAIAVRLSQIAAGVSFVLTGLVFVAIFTVLWAGLMWIAIGLMLCYFAGVAVTINLGIQRGVYRRNVLDGEVSDEQALVSMKRTGVYSTSTWMFILGIAISAVMALPAFWLLSMLWPQFGYFYGF